MPAIDQALNRLGLTANDLTAVAAARGPGSFTGLRVGLAVAQGLALALRVPMYGIGSLDVLVGSVAWRTGPVWAILEAGRGRMATAVFEPDGDAFQQVGSVMGVDLDSLVRLMERRQHTERSAIIGDLDQEARRRLAGLEQQVWVASPALSVRRPAILAELAWQRRERGQMPGPDDGEPIYLARSQ